MPVSDQGIFRDRYVIIPRVLVFTTRGDSVLLLKGAPDKRLWPNLYNGVGGHIEAGESILDAAHREFNEETGLELISPWLVGVVMIDTGTNPGIGMYIFRGSAGEGALIQSSEGRLEWINISQLDQIDMVEDLPVILPIVLKQPPGQPPFSARYWYNDSGKLEIELSGPNS
jgi:8-oxo-dGTP diphosphatase